MGFDLPTIDAVSLAAWCEAHLGSPPELELFRAHHLTGVIGMRLADGREVVIKVRPAAPRVAACTEVQRRLFESGYPCPQPLAGPAPLDRCEATAESYIPGGTALPDSGRAAQPFAAALAQLVHLAPGPEQVASLAPAPPWAAWNHGEGRLWPWPEDLDLDLNLAAPSWIDAAGQAARQILRDGQDRTVIAHADWITDNLRWNGNRLLVAYDWDSLIADTEPVIVGLAAAIYLMPAALPTIAETHEFLDAYAAVRERPFTPGELQRCWAAGLWTRAYEAKKEQAAGGPVTSLTQSDADERLRQAGVR